MLRDVADIEFAPDGNANALYAEAMTLASLRRRDLPSLTAPHRLGFDVLLVLTSGRGVHMVDGVEVNVVAGDVLVLHAGQVHAYRSSLQMDGHQVLVRRGFRGRPVTGNTGRGRLPDVDAAALRRLVQQVMKVGHARERSTSARQAAVLHLAQAAFALASTAPTLQPSAVSGVVQRYEALLDEHVAHQTSVGWYAAQLGCATRTLTRHCQVHLGQGAKEVLQARLLLEAKRALVEHDLVEDAAYALGFEEPTNFSKFFKAHTGTTPSAYRARLGL